MSRFQNYSTGALGRVLGLFRKQKALAALLLIFVLMIFPKTNFYTSYNLIDMLNSGATLLILAFGVTFTVICGACDLSVGGIMVGAGILTIKLMDFLPIGLAIFAALVFGAMVGVVNAFFVVHQKTEPFIITLGTGLLLTGLCQVLTDSKPVSPTNPVFMRIANDTLVWKFTNLVLITLVVFVLMHLLLRHTAYGRNCYAIGGDYEVARYSGIKVIQVKSLAFVLCGVMAALAGVLLSSKLNSGNYVYGQTTALVVNCGVVVGGVSFSGGVGSIPQAALGLLVFAVLDNCMNMLGVSSYLQTLIKGLAIVGIIWLDSYTQKREREDV